MHGITGASAETTKRKGTGASLFRIRYNRFPLQAEKTALKKSFDSISTYAHIVCVFLLLRIYIYYAGCPLPQKHHPRFRPFGPRASPLTQNMRLYPSQHDRLDATTPWLLLLSLCRRIQFTSSAYSFNQVYTPRPGHGRARLIHRESKNTRHLTFAHNFTKY